MGFGTITDILNASASNSYSFWFFGTFTIGITAVVRVNQLSIKRISGNSYSLYFNTTYEANRFGDSATSEIIGAYVKITCGGTTLIDDWDYDIWWTSSYNRSSSYTITLNENTPTDLYISVSCWAGANSRDVQATATTSQTFKLQRSEDQVISATSGNQNYILLPQANSDTSGQLYFYKNFSGTRSLIFPPENQTLDDVSLRCIYLYQYEGVILFNNGSNWYVASYYNKDELPKTSESVSVGSYSATAQINQVNIRNAGDNGKNYLWNLPDPSTNSGKMCILVYGGYYTSGSKLLITSNGSTGIDNGYYDNNSNKLYIQANIDTKPTGIILVSNGTTWCIMGFYYTTGATFTNSTGTNANITANAALQINVAPLSQSNRRLLLPPYNATYNSVGSQLLILKTTTKGDGNPDIFRTNGTDKIGTGSSSSFNSCEPATPYTLNEYGCTIFVSRKKADADSLEYFPVCNY